MTFPRDEVARACRHYFMVGPVLEDRIAWSQLFTEDSTYADHFLGRVRRCSSDPATTSWLGRDDIRPLRSTRDVDFGDRFS